MKILSPNTLFPFSSYNIFLNKAIFESQLPLSLLSDHRPPVSSESSVIAWVQPGSSRYTGTLCTSPAKHRNFKCSKIVNFRSKLPWRPLVMNSPFSLEYASLLKTFTESLAIGHSSLKFKVTELNVGNTLFFRLGNRLMAHLVCLGFVQWDSEKKQLIKEFCRSLDAPR